VFAHHAAAASGALDLACSGAEWWVQHRELPAASCAGSGGGAEAEAAGGLGWHWDRDVSLYASCGCAVHPQISTVTYLTDAGAPTCVVEKRSAGDGFALAPPAATAGGAAEGAEAEDEAAAAAAACFYVSHPQAGKHISFDGRLLHCVPAELTAAQPPAASAAARSAGGSGGGGDVGGSGDADDSGGSGSGGGSSRCRTRVSLLVNVWLNHRPEAVAALPQAVARGLSRAAPGDFLGEARTVVVGQAPGWHETRRHQQAPAAAGEARGEAAAAAAAMAAGVVLTFEYGAEGKDERALMCSVPAHALAPPAKGCTFALPLLDKLTHKIAPTHAAAAAGSE
jgi:hypothetical protein